jgi:hypothetical protein
MNLRLVRDAFDWGALWARELAGWGLVVLGLGAFYLVYDFCERHYLVEACVFLVAGIFVFRGGIHLLKVAVAARVCRQAQEQLRPSATAAAAPERKRGRGLPRLGATWGEGGPDERVA